MKVTYVDHMGTDKSVVNAARVSFKGNAAGIGETTELTERDEGLIRFLARGCTTQEWEAEIDIAMANGGYIFGGDRDFAEQWMKNIARMPPHWTPFGHTAITVYMDVPVPYATQIKKHTTGFVVNEISRRYVSTEPRFHVPKAYRQKAASVKQGSSEKTVQFGLGGTDLVALAEEHMKRSETLYRHFLDSGVAAEQARELLPQAMYTEMMVTGNLYGFANLFIQRSHSHAQRETQAIAKMIGEVIEPLFPVSWAALTR